jgi:hypothetical protein
MFCAETIGNLLVVVMPMTILYNIEASRWKALIKAFFRLRGRFFKTNSLSLILSPNLFVVLAELFPQLPFSLILILWSATDSTVTIEFSLLRYTVPTLPISTSLSMLKLLSISYLSCPGCISRHVEFLILFQRRATVLTFFMTTLVLMLT